MSWVWSYTRRLRQKALPSASELAEEARSLAASDAHEHVFREVERLLSDARDEYRPRNELIVGLRRVALASGTGLSLLVLTRGVSLAQLPTALVTFAAGVVGAIGVGLVGRSAQARARSAREHFAKLGRKLRLELQPELPGEPRNSRPSSGVDSASEQGCGDA